MSVLNRTEVHFCDDKHKTAFCLTKKFVKMSLYDEDEIMEDLPSFEEDIGVPLDDEDMEDQVTK